MGGGEPVAHAHVRRSAHACDEKKKHNAPFTVSAVTTLVLSFAGGGLKRQLDATHSLVREHGFSNLVKVERSMCCGSESKDARRAIGL